MRPLRKKILSALSAGAVAAAGLVAIGVSPAAATPGGDNGSIVYTRAEYDDSRTVQTYRICVVDPTTGVSRMLPLPSGTTAAREAVFSPDGSRVAYWAAAFHPGMYYGWRLFTARADGSDIREITAPLNQLAGPIAWTPDGVGLLITRGEQSASAVHWVPADGGEPTLMVDFFVHETTGPPTITSMSVADDGVLVVSTTSSQNRRVWLLKPGGEVQRIKDNAQNAEFDPSGEVITYRGAATPDEDQRLWQPAAMGRDGLPVDLAEIETGTVFERVLPSPDGMDVAYTKVKPGSECQVLAVRRGTEAPVNLAGGGRYCVTNASWQPVRKNYVNRLGGRTSIETAVTAAQALWSDKNTTREGFRPAKTVVLTRNDHFGDGLVGVPLAAAKQGPLLLSERDRLPAATAAEMTRILPKGATVYVLGGALAIKASVEQQIRALGFTVKRLAGASQYETAIAIANETNPNPKHILFATGRSYYDALAAGPAAANMNAVVLLTDGVRLPGSVKTYLSQHKAADVWGTGGPAATALYQDGDRPYYQVQGRDAVDTATTVARTFFHPPQVAGIATTASFHDAMSGGALLASAHGPILLSAKTGLAPSVTNYLRANGASLRLVAILGGTTALPKPIATSVGNEIGLPGSAVYFEGTAPAAVSLRRGAGTEVTAPAAASIGTPGDTVAPLGEPVRKPVKNEIAKD